MLADTNNPGIGVNWQVKICPILPGTIFCAHKKGRAIIPTFIPPPSYLSGYTR